MKCQYYEGRTVRCERQATQAVYLRKKERIGRVCAEHSTSLTSHHPRTITAKPMQLKTKVADGVTPR